MEGSSLMVLDDLGRNLQLLKCVCCLWFWDQNYILTCSYMYVSLSNISHEATPFSLLPCSLKTIMIMWHNVDIRLGPRDSHSSGSLYTRVRLLFVTLLISTIESKHLLSAIRNSKSPTSQQSSGMDLFVPLTFFWHVTFCMYEQAIVSKFFQVK